MTPEEIQPEQIVCDIMMEFDQFDDSPECTAMYNNYIAKIKQYAREMCDKQKKECDNAWQDCEEDREVEVKAIQNAPYPKELL